jgi:hypothetical protein
MDMNIRERFYVSRGNSLGTDTKRGRDHLPDAREGPFWWSCFVRLLEAYRTRFVVGAFLVGHFGWYIQFLELRP